MDWFWFALISAIFISVETILEKKVLKREHALQFSAIISISMVVVSLIFLPYLNFDNLSPSILLLVYFASWLSAFSFLLVSKAIRHMEVSTVTPFLSFGPIFTLIFSLLFLKEHINNLQITGMMMVILGAYVLQSKKTDYLAPVKEIIKSRYIHYIFIALILNGFGAMIDRYILKNNFLDPLSYLFLITLFLAINYNILISVLYKGIKDINKGFKANGLIILIIAVTLLLSRIFLLEAFSLAPAFLVEPVKRISVIFVIVFGGAILHEKYLFKKFIASLLILGGIYLITI
ncbi:MAG: EamA family transporter [Nanoarchaeota archaeon]